MKKFTRIALAFSVGMLALSACQSQNTDTIIRTEVPERPAGQLPPVSFGPKGRPFRRAHP